MNKFLSVFVSSLLLLSSVGSLPAKASGPTTVVCLGGGSFTITSNVVSDGVGCVGEAVISASVTRVDNYSFENASGLVAVRFEAGSSLTSIGDSAFLGSGLTAVVIPSAVTSIEVFAFASTPTLSSVTFASGSSLLSLGTKAFTGSGISAISFPTGFLSVGTFAFENNLSLTSVTFPASIQTITASAFRGSTSLTSISFAGNLAPANVHEDAFAGIGSLATANIAYEARSSFGLNGSTWKGLVVSYAEPEPTPDPSSDYTPAPAPVVPDPVTTKSTSFVFDSVVLSKSNKKVIRVLFREFGVLGIYKVKTGVLFIPLTTKAQDKALALKKARAIKRYLIGLGVKKKNITVSSKVYKAGVAVRTSVSGSKKAIS